MDPNLGKPVSSLLSLSEIQEKGDSYRKITCSSEVLDIRWKFQAVLWEKQGISTGHCIQMVWWAIFGSLQLRLMGQGVKERRRFRMSGSTTAAGT